METILYLIFEHGEHLLFWQLLWVDAPALSLQRQSPDYTTLLAW